MSQLHLRPCLICLALVLAVPVSAEFNRTSLLIDIPTADVMPPGAVAFGMSGSQGVQRNPVSPGAEADLSLRVTPFRNMEFAVTAYTRTTYVFGASFRVFDGRRKYPSLAVGVHDVGIQNSVSSLGSGSAGWPDEDYPDRPTENLSAYAVTSIPVPSPISWLEPRIHAGIGRGRYVGYGNHSKYLNSDYLAGSHNPWVFGLFGGGELKFGRYLALAAEIDGRDANAGLKFNYGPISVGAALTKLEGLVFPADEKFHRVAISVGYELDQLFASRKPIRPGAPTHVAEAKPAPLPEPEIVSVAEPPPPAEPPAEPPLPEVAAITPVPASDKPLPSGVTETHPTALTLAPIFFDFDSSSLRSEAKAILAEHARVLIEHPEVKITILGMTDEIGSPEYNLKLSEQRAFRVYEFLKACGVDARRMAFRGLGRQYAAPDEPVSLYRRCEFEVEVK